MSGIELSLILVGLFFVALFIFPGKPGALFSHLTTNKWVGRGWIGVLLAFLFFMTVSIFFGEKAEAVTVDFYLGVDEVRVQSPQCKPEWEEWSDNLTSNIGLNLWVMRSQYVSTTIQQSHASCVYNQDRNVWDTTGGHVYFHFGPVDIGYGKDYYYDIGAWSSTYTVRWQLFSSQDGRASFSLKYTQRDMNDRMYESRYNYKGGGAEVRLRTDFNWGKRNP